MSETYNDWMERAVAGRESPALESHTTVTASAGEPFGVIEFLRLSRKCYVGEVGKKSGDYIYHFFPVEHPPDSGESWLPHDFEDKMGDAFLEVFKLDDRVQAVFSPELGSWAVKAVGFAANPMADELALKLFDVLDQKLE